MTNCVKDSGMNSFESQRYVTIVQLSRWVSGKKKDEKTSHICEEIGVGRWSINDRIFYLIGSMMGGEEFNQQ